MTRVRVAILDDYQGVSTELADWSRLHDQVDVQVYRDTLSDEDSLIKRLEPYTIICAMRERTKFPASLLDKLPNLRLITTTGLQNRGIDIAAAKSKGIVVSGTTGVGNSTLEHIWAILLGAVRYIAQEDRRVKQANTQWQHVIPLGLHGKTLGLVGLGNLGKGTARIAKAFNMHVIAWSPHLTQERCDEAGVGFAKTKEALFSTSDIVSIQMVLSPSTRHLIGASDFSIMKPTAFFVNTSRGPIVDEAALVDVLKRKAIAGAGLDVYDLEPLPLDHPLRSLDNVTLSPHLGYVSDDNYKVGRTTARIASR
ncbi:D-isomer specific 2-hydroxyacid dehydrogenase [Sistotremastrum suecicum HHB10207 ss-3]|uniref:D-isomer specific 2-hydroxyacid dehydrogenase n=1 Tax=Sistotremastrum suecicum HHB10207 ss-3 TaxID=1314776 RepID=A0A166HCI1_9AGAM|nr:D-isomer specific 2-hydroxyacid dehydrogenase [Sistotremastrum suecicum HHB10207 ss-3]